MAMDNAYKILYRGIVRRLASDGVYVEVPTLGIDMEFGPVEVPPFPVKVGQKVLVGQLEGEAEDLAIITALLDDVSPGGAGIPAFANAAARDAEITAPEEGMFAWLNDVNQLTAYYDGLWKNYAADFVLTTDPRLSDARMPSNDANLVHKTGTEAVGGVKTFTSQVRIGPDVAGQYMTFTGGATNHGIEVGRSDGVASAPYIDFHSDSAPDYSARIWVNTGPGTTGDAPLNIVAGDVRWNGVTLVKTDDPRLIGGSPEDAKVAQLMGVF